MLTLQGRNVNQLYHMASGVCRDDNIMVQRETRAGSTRTASSPVMSVYDRPREKVLFHLGRRANPFFHLFESLWMLAGRSDADWLDLFVSDFSSRFAEEGGQQHGAYGRRWRNWFYRLPKPEGNAEVNDQLAWTISRLKENPEDRRVVIQMYDAHWDQRYADEGGKDVPCNVVAFPRIHEGVLDMTICNRSNDVVWGCYGANAVHFAFLLEYLAAALDVGVGKMYQMSNNWHVYDATADKLVPPDEKYYDHYTHGIVSHQPLVMQPTTFLRELDIFLENPLDHNIYENKFLSDVAHPMYSLWNLHKKKEYEACRTFLVGKDNEWLYAAKLWFGDKL